MDVERPPAVRSTASGALRRPWLRYVLGGALLIGIYYALPSGGDGQAAIFLAAPAAGAALCLRRSVRTPGGGRFVWASLSAALGLATASDVIYLGYPMWTGRDLPFPSVMDGIWLASYPFYLLALWAMLRQQRDLDRLGNLLDVAIIATNGAIPLWTYVIDPHVDSPSASLLVNVAAAGYPCMDLLLFAMLLRFVVVARTTAAMRLLVLAVGALLVADLSYMIALTNGNFGYGGPPDALWIGSGVLVGAAALHASGDRFQLEARQEEHRLTARRMVFLGLALLVGPVVLSQRPGDTVFLATMSAVSFGLVMTRMWLLNRNLTTARAAVEETSDQLRHQALHDSLTGLPNRALLLDRIDRMQARVRRTGSDCVVLLVDLDGFKAVNDALGHAAGDRLLLAVAERLRTALPDVHTIGRVGGDEFVVLVENPVSAGAPELIAERVLDLLRQPFDLGGGGASTIVSASIGVAVGPRPSAGELLREADVALYEAKAAGRNCSERFRPEMEAVIQRRYELEIDLRAALAREEFFLLYQPIWDLSRVRLAGFEALLRWGHPTKGLVGPQEFIPLLEASGLIVDVGRWVMRTACRQAAAWRAAGSDVYVSVNVSGRQLDRDSVVDHVDEALRESGLTPGALTVEITETALMTNVAETTRRLCELKALGVRVAVDDFGTGYSSLAYLQRFPVDCLKIDRTFTDAIGRSPESDAMMHTLVQLGKRLRLQTLAEGVETPDQMSHLRSEEVDSVQGFLLAKPLPVDAALRLVEADVEAELGADVDATLTGSTFTGATLTGVAGPADAGPPAVPARRSDAGR